MVRLTRGAKQSDHVSRRSTLRQIQANLIQKLPYDDNIEPLASPEEIGQYEQSEAEEDHNEHVIQQRFNADIEIASWLVYFNIYLFK